MAAVEPEAKAVEPEANLDELSFEQLEQHEDLTSAEYQLLLNAVDVIYTGVSATEVIFSVKNNQASLYRIYGRASFFTPGPTDVAGIIVLRKIIWPAGKELELYLMAGKSLLRSSVFNQVHEFCRTVAKDTECRWLSTTTPIKTLITLYNKRFNGPYSTKYLEEIK
jgi:hypothetical protein